MKKNSPIILAALVAAVLGLSAGYLLFGGKTAGEPAGHEHAAQDAGEEKETIYTCSMHPQIRQNEPGLCPICEMDLIPLDNAQSDDPLVLQMTPEAVKLAQIQTTTVGRASAGEKTLELTGKVATDERRVASQVAHVPGRIEQLFVTFTGERVRKGQRLARLYSPELITAQRELLEARRLGDSTLLASARRKLRFWKVPEEMVENVLTSGDIRETIDVTAEVSGVVTRRKVAVGDYVKEGAVLFDIADLAQVWILFDAYEEDLAYVRTGDRVAFQAPSLPNRTFTTRISFIDPVIDPETRVASLRAEVSNPDGLLKPAMLVRGTLQSPVRDQGRVDLAVPKSAVLWTGKRSVVYVRLPNAEVPSYEYREVLLGEPLGSAYLVESGLEPGEEVVTYGAFTIDAAAQLNNQASMMNRLVNVQGTPGAQTPDYASAVPKVFKEQLAALVEQYVAVKDALVETDPGNAAAAAEGYIKALNGVDMYLLEGQAHLYWMDQEQAMKAHAGKIAESDDVNQQRRQFEFLSNLMIETVRAFGAGGRQLFVQHCPMAFDDQGADWLSYEGQILNPYFGDKMLKCGIVKDSIGSLAGRPR